MRPHDHAGAQVSGLLADRAPGFAAYLAGRGYAKSSVDHHLYLIADLSAWLAGQGLDAGDLAGPAADRFWDNLRARGSYLAKGTSLRPLLDYLRGIGVLPEQAGGPASAADALLHEYERYLRAERGAGEVTAGHYLRHAQEFLDVAGWPQDGPEFGAGLAGLDGAQVLDIVSRQAARHRLPSVGAALTGDRAFLRFLEHSRRTARPLSAAVPRAARQPSRLPVQVDPAVAAAIVASCDRSAEGGCRDRAVLLLLHRYGLRPVEVTRLNLADLRWRAGEFVVHGKGGRVDVLPLVPGRRGGDRGIPAGSQARAARSHRGVLVRPCAGAADVQELSRRPRRPGLRQGRGPPDRAAGIPARRRARPAERRRLAHGDPGRAPAPRHRDHERVYPGGRIVAAAARASLARQRAAEMTP